MEGQRSFIEGIIRTFEVHTRSDYRAGQSRRVSKARTEIAFLLRREMDIPMADIARRLGVGTSAIAMAIGRKYCAEE